MPPSRFRSALVVANPIAGRGRGASEAQRIANALTERGIAARVHSTQRRGDARDTCRALPQDVDVVVSVGGDGTLSEVLEGLGERDVPVAVLPLGTANVLALDLRFPRDAAGLVRTIESGREQRIDTARVNGRLSFLVVGVGFDAAVVHALERLRRGPISKATWVRAALETYARHEEPRLRVEVDGRALDGEFGWVLVSNVIHYAGWRVLADDRALDDGRFEVYGFRSTTRLALLRHGWTALVARFPARGVERVLGSRVRVTSDRPVPFQIDGDAAGTTPVDVEVVPRTHRILVP